MNTVDLKYVTDKQLLKHISSIYQLTDYSKQLAKGFMNNQFIQWTDEMKAAE